MMKHNNSSYSLKTVIWVQLVSQKINKNIFFMKFHEHFLHWLTKQKHSSAPKPTPFLTSVFLCWEDVKQNVKVNQSTNSYLYIFSYDKVF